MKFNASRGESNVNVIRLKSGESITGVLKGDPHEFEKAFKQGEKPKFRFRVNIVVSGQNGMEAKILEGGWKLYKNLQDLQAAGWDLEKSYTKIARQGTTMNDTIYTANTLPTAVSPDTLAKVANVPLLPLQDGQQQGEPPHSADDSDLPF